MLTGVCQTATGKLMQHCASIFLNSLVARTSLPFLGRIWPVHVVIFCDLPKPMHFSFLLFSCLTLLGATSQGSFSPICDSAHLSSAFPRSLLTFDQLAAIPPQPKSVMTSSLWHKVERIANHDWHGTKSLHNAPISGTGMYRWEDTCLFLYVQPFKSLNPSIREAWFRMMFLLLP